MADLPPWRARRGCERSAPCQAAERANPSRACWLRARPTPQLAVGSPYPAAGRGHGVPGHGVI